MQIQQKEVKMKTAILMCIALAITMSACHEKEQTHLPGVDVIPSVTASPSPSATPAVTATPVQGHIVISGDFSPQCPAKPGFVPPLAGEACEVGTRTCSSGLIYICESNAPALKSMSAEKCFEIDGVKYCKNLK
jgi:hypothetical protein